jgi:SHS family lactate transporter-like MFS transporter
MALSQSTTMETGIAASVGRNPPASDWKSSFLAGLTGWTLDAFDFFLVVFSLTAIGRTFHQSDKSVTYALLATLALRPVGALLFGGIADRYGRRLPLAANLVLFAVVELLTGFAHNFYQFLTVRAVFGVVMGGQWGVGVSLAMEKVPVRLRGLLSGFLQQGYAIGFLLAAAAYYVLYDRFGWRPLFLLGSLPALCAAGFILLRVRESEVWERTRHSNWAGLGRGFAGHWKLFVYFTFFMMAMHMSSHGTQDLYPTFLERTFGFGAHQRATLSAISMVGAIVGGLSIGALSDKVGRRRAMVIALVGAIFSIPLWAFASNIHLLVIGAVLIQFFVQGAWGVVPAHLAEMSPDSLRGSLPGLGNQCGVLLAAIAPTLEAGVAHRYGYADSMAVVAAVVFGAAILLTILGGERRGTAFGAQ